ncbi:MAG: LCP family protein [Clostridia bacterium]|nr:LCP family protein [Clostridia bacterium]
MSKQNDVVNPTEKKQKKKKTRKVILWIFLSLVIIILALAVAAAVAFGVMYNKGKISMSNEEIKVTAPEGAELIDDGAEVHYKGKKYNFNKNLTSILIMGVDKKNIDDVGDEGYNGQADALFLLVADTSTGEVDLINISRDCMVNMDVYTPDGDFIKTGRLQLCLAYAYGKDEEASAANVIKSLSELMYGIPINSYFTMDLQAVQILTDAVGGVSVPEYTKDQTKPTGRTITVYGRDAENYIRNRNSDILDSNLTRMERQKAFISAFVSKVVSLTKQNIKTPVNLFNSLDGYIHTDIGIDEVTYMAANFLSGVANMDNYSIAGTVVKGEKYAEYEVDMEALYDLVLEVFYTEVT